MKRIIEMTVTYEDGSSDTYCGRGTTVKADTHDSHNTPPRPSEVNMHYVSATLLYDSVRHSPLEPKG